MKQRTRTPSAVVCEIGFAVGANGEGIAYLARRENGASQGAPDFARAVRIPFRCSLLAGLLGREIAYAAITAAAAYLLARGYRDVELAVADDALVADVRERRPVPPALAIPYVALRCRLNRFERATLVASHDRSVADLTARARTEAALLVAA